MAVDDQHVAGFQVAVHDVVFVRMLHRVEHREAQLEPLGRGQLVIVGVAIDRGAPDVLHHEIGQPFGRGASVEEARDVGMIQRGQDLTFVAEAADDQVGVHAAPDHLDRDRVLEIVGAPRQIDGTHAAAADQPFDVVMAELGTDVRIVIVSGAERARGECLVERGRG